MIDFLNLKDDDLEDRSAGGGFFNDPDLFNPNPKSVDSNVYKAVFRWIPWWKDPKNSKYKKYTTTFKDPVTQEFFRIDCPSTVGKSSVLWALDSMLRKKKKDKVDLDTIEEINKYFNRYYNFYSPIYMYNDPQVPENNDKIFIYNYGWTIYSMQEALKNPESVEGLTEIKPIEPFSLTDGKDFLLVVKLKNQWGKDYDSSKFLDGATTPFRFKMGDKGFKVRPGSTPEESQKINALIGKYLQDNTPDLEKFYYKEWTDDDYKRVAQFLKAIIPVKGFMAELIDSTRDEKMKGLLIAETRGSGSAPRPKIPSENPQIADTDSDKKLAELADINLNDAADDFSDLTSDDGKDIPAAGKTKAAESGDDLLNSMAETEESENENAYSGATGSSGGDDEFNDLLKDLP